MNMLSGKQWIPYPAAILIFLVITLVYMSPVLSGKSIKQGDISQWKGMSKEIRDYRQETGEEPLWTNSMFGGMPAYQISVKYTNNLIKDIDRVLRLGLPRPADYLFLTMLGFFILLLAFRVNPWLSIVGAIAFAFSSYFFIILEAGHNSKAHAIAYMAPVIAGVYLTYRGKFVLGSVLTLLFVSLEISTNHLQITYYLILILIALGIAELIHHLQNNMFPRFLKATGLLLAAGLLAVGPNITNILLTNEYSPYTIRGESELTENQDNKTSGLDKDYATQWSYGIQETVSLMIPNVKGGGTDMIGNKVDDLSDVDRQWRQAIQQQNAYWGNQPFTSGPVYVGAVIFFLFILGLFIVKNHLKWALLAVTILSVMLAWGNNMMWFTDFFLDNVPGYNKFRTVSMTLVIAELAIPLLALITLYQLYRDRETLKRKQKQFFIALGLTAGLALVFYITPTTFFDFYSNQEVQAFEQQRTNQPQHADQIAVFTEQLKQVRIEIFRTDTLRSLFFILITGGLLYLYSRKMLKTGGFVAAIGFLVLIDMWPVNKRYINNDHCVSKSQVRRPFPVSEADKQILADSDPNFRVYNMAVNSFNDAGTSYFHKSIGGYHGAKLRRYQELIDYHIKENNMPVLNMLNTKYFIRQGRNNQPQVQRNPDALGNAWFIEQVKIVDNADEEIRALNDFDPEKTAFVDQRFRDKIKGFDGTADVSGEIKLTEYEPNYLKYESQNPAEQVAVFSEIYYPLGWQAYIDGEPADHFRANYVLRAMVIPEGEHTIEFKFEPQSYYTGETIALTTSILVILLVLGGIGYEVKRNYFENK
ncbi:MAG: YfhO family protein [Bacteroidota bacterium]